MPDLPFGNPNTEPFDLDAANNTLGTAVMGMVQLMLRPAGTMPEPAEAKAVMEGMRQGLMAGTQACAEVKRIRGELTSLRDQHRPQPHADPNAPGALCAACSIHGALVAWPCGTWSAAERILNHGKA